MRVKTCLRHLHTKKGQTSLRILISAIVIHKFIEKYILSCYEQNFNFQAIVSEQIGLNITLSETLKTGLLAMLVSQLYY